MADGAGEPHLDPSLEDQERPQQQEELDERRASIIELIIGWLVVLGIFDAVQYRIFEFGYFDCSPGVLALLIGAVVLAPATAYPFFLGFLWRTSMSSGARALAAIGALVGVIIFTLVAGFMWLMFHMCP